MILNNSLKFLPFYMKDSLSTLQTTIPEELTVPFNESIDENVPLCHFLIAYGLCSFLKNLLFHSMRALMRMFHCATSSKLKVFVHS